MAPRKAKAKEESTLLKALRFVSVSQQEAGTEYQTHCRLYGGMATAFNGVLSAGYPLDDDTKDMSLCPNTFQLIAALSRVATAYSLAALDNGHLSIKTDTFKAMVPTLAPDRIGWAQPDNCQYPINDGWKKAALVASLFATEGAQTMMAASVVTRDQSIAGTNGTVCLEAWHGISTPPGLVIPKIFITALSKVASPMTRFGFTQETFTVLFEDGSWLKTQLYQEPYVNVDRVFKITETAVPVPIPAGLFNAMEAVIPFCVTSAVILGGGMVRSHHEDEGGIGASHTCAEAVVPVIVSHKLLKPLEPYINAIDFNCSKELIAVFGENLRGAVAKMTR